MCQGDACEGGPKWKTKLQETTAFQISPWEMDGQILSFPLPGQILSFHIHWGVFVLVTQTGY